MDHNAATHTETLVFSPTAWSERYQMLDGWRGLAALAVVIGHMCDVPTGHRAVMLFFVISGYCIMASTEACTAKGLGFASFMWRRMRRIYPPYFCALAWFVITRLAKASAGGENQLAKPIGVWIQNLTLTQWLTMLVSPTGHPADTPASFLQAFWSLNYEEQFYLLMACLLFIPYRAARLGIIGVLMAASLWWRIDQLGVFRGLFIEYWLYFGVGCLVFWRLCRMTDRRLQRLTDAGLATATVASVVLAYSATGLPSLLVYELPVVTSFALLLIALRSYDAWFRESWLGDLLMRLGTISYSLYLIHQCNIQLCRSITSRLGLQSFPTADLAVQVALHLAIAAIFWWFCERPFLRLQAAPNTSLSEPSATDRRDLLVVYRTTRQSRAAAILRLIDELAARANPGRSPKPISAPALLSQDANLLNGALRHSARDLQVQSQAAVDAIL